MLDLDFARGGREKKIWEAEEDVVSLLYDGRCFPAPSVLRFQYGSAYTESGENISKVRQGCLGEAQSRPIWGGGGFPNACMPPFF